MLAARAVRNKKKKKEENVEVPRGPYIKPFGPRFDSSELPYFKYSVTIRNLTLEMELLSMLFERDLLDTPIKNYDGHLVIATLETL